MDFEWDPRKAAQNLRKHGVSFVEAATVFDDPMSITVPDPEHSTTAERLIIVGWSDRHRALIVAHEIRKNRFRLISA